MKKTIALIMAVLMVLAIPSVAQAKTVYSNVIRIPKLEKKVEAEAPTETVEQPVEIEAEPAEKIAEKNGQEQAAEVAEAEQTSGTDNAETEIKQETEDAEQPEIVPEEIAEPVVTEIEENTENAEPVTVTADEDTKNAETAEIEENDEVYNVTEIEDKTENGEETEPNQEQTEVGNKNLEDNEQTKVAYINTLGNYGVAEDGNVYEIENGKKVDLTAYKVSTGDLDLNYRINEDGEAVGTLSGDSEVFVVERSDEWSVVLIDDVLYLVRSKYIAPVDYQAEEEEQMSREYFNSLVAGIKISYQFEGTELEYGDPVTVVADIPSELDGADIRWQEKAENGEWCDLVGANASSYTFNVDETNVNSMWRVVLSIG